MNFLAHIFLSGDDPDIKIGNFIGDFVKGTDLEKFQSKIKLGILLHREIDHFTDTHPTVMESKIRLRTRYRHFAPVIADIYFDHFLAANWKLYSDENLEEYAKSFYELTIEYQEIIPDAANYMLTYMRRDNWLYAYRTVEGIGKALSGLSRRTKFDSKMDESVNELRRNYQEYKSEFDSFFPELIKFSNDSIRSLST